MVKNQTIFFPVSGAQAAAKELDVLGQRLAQHLRLLAERRQFRRLVRLGKAQIAVGSRRAQKKRDHHGHCRADTRAPAGWELTVPTPLIAHDRTCAAF